MTQGETALDDQEPADQRGEQQNQHHGLDQQAGIADQTPDGHVFESGVHRGSPL